VASVMCGGRDAADETMSGENIDCECGSRSLARVLNFWYA